MPRIDSRIINFMYIYYIDNIVVNQHFTPSILVKYKL